MKRLYIYTIIITVMVLLFPELGWCESTTNLEYLKHENDLLHSRNNVNLLACMMLMALVMMLFVWNIKKNNRRHMIQLQRKNNALQIEHDQAVKARKEAEKASQMKTLFLQQITHEIRTPLNAISGFSQLLSNPDMDFSKEKKQELGEMVMQSTTHLTDMLNDIIILAETDNNTYVTFTPESISLQGFAAQLENVTHLSLKVEGHEGSEGDATFSSDIAHLKLAVQNVVSNAVKFGKESTVDMLLTKDLLRITVTDDGPGIAPEDREQLFQRFYKKDPFIPGVGLGLCVSRSILNSLGGNVFLDETYDGKGARFVIELRIEN